MLMQSFDKSITASCRFSRFPARKLLSLRNALRSVCRFHWLNLKSDGCVAVNKTLIVILDRNDFSLCVDGHDALPL